MDRGYFAHESAYVDDGAKIGDGTKIWHFCHVQPGAVIGRNCILGQNVNVAGGAIIGDNCKIQNNVSVYEGVVLEDDVFCGPSCVFTNDHQPRAHSSLGWKVAPTLVRHGASIGANATIVCGNTLGRWSMVGSGAVVAHDVSDHALVVGVPARQVGWVCDCGAELDEELHCSECGKSFEKCDCGLREVGAGQDGATR
ncbi:MAG: DapH/DapD/GlmU-related protein [Coriobacteriales bacterium]|jgi:UDP-2-acetamido-3-amino-2,3-dideoxy-glucuronate N-acetyltransferase